MVKYILKRLGISVIILLGVSVIIYSLVRMMPTDYVDQKYASQLQSGAIKQEDIDRFKELYGLSMPEAYYTIEVEGGDCEGEYVRKVKKQGYADAMLSDSELNSFLVGTYEDGNKVLTISESGKFEIRTDGELKELGQINAKLKVDGENKTIELSLGDLNVSETYKEATFFNKFGAILSGYFDWMGNLAKGDLGTSFTHNKPVSEVISSKMWISFSIALVATILQFLIAIPLGISSATHQYSAQDYIVTIFTMLGISLPTYFFAAVAIKIFSVDLGLFPASGLVYANKNYAETFVGFISKTGDIIHHMILPIFVNVILSLGGLMRYTRTNTLEVLSADYIRTARAKGLSEKTVIYKHAFRNTLIPLATLLASVLPSLFGGMMITEEVFGIDGIGRLAYQALVKGDVPFVMGYNMFLAVLTVIGTLLSDIMYSLVDPRVKLGG